MTENDELIKAYKKRMRRKELLEQCANGIITVLALGWMSVIIFTAIHFIVKFW